MHRETRRFGLGDLMILIAAFGVAMVGMRTLRQGLTEDSAAIWWDSTPARLIVAMMLSACATPMTLACLVFRFRRPRPAWRRVSIQPGTVALVACSVIFVARTLEVAVSISSPAVAKFGMMFARSSPIHFGDSVDLVLVRTLDRNGVIGSIDPLACTIFTITSFASPCGSTVVAAWLILAFSGRWRPERSWIDRLGRVLGVTWIVISILAALPV